MRRLQRDKKGQFIIIAFLMMAIIMISMGAIIHRSGTYYKHEPWEEYLTLISDIEVNTRRLVELSLANYTNTAGQNSDILDKNLLEWQTNLNKMYPSLGIELSYTLASGGSKQYSKGLNLVWNQASSYSAANASIILAIKSIGLKGYKFSTPSFLNVRILSATGYLITLIVENEKKTPAMDLNQNSIQVNGYNVTHVSSEYSPTNGYVYVVTCDKSITTPVTVNAWDQRGIRVTAKFP